MNANSGLRAAVPVEDRPCGPLRCDRTLPPGGTAVPEESEPVVQFNALIPELTVSDIAVSKAFYLGLLGFTLEYERSEEKFAFVSLGEAQLMLEQYHEAGWNAAELQKPFGRGINLSIDTPAIDDIYARVQAAGHPLYRLMMRSAYEVNGELVGQREFLVQDPDGYLLRFTYE